MASTEHVDGAGGAGEVIDRLSLEQALLDFEVANARVIDLTARLLELTTQLGETRAELDRERALRSEIEAEHNAMKGSQAWRLATRIWNVRNALGF